MMSINAVKGVEIGDGFSVVEQRGSRAPRRDSSGGLSFKPRRGRIRRDIHGPRYLCQSCPEADSSITQPGKSINRHGEPVDVVTKGRHDPCVGVRATPIAEAMMALVLMDHLIRYRGQVSERDRRALRVKKEGGRKDRRLD